MGNSVIVKTEFGEVQVRKMALADYAEVLKALDNIPKAFQTYFKDVDNDRLSKMDNSEYVALLPGLLATSWSDLVAVIAVPTDKDAEFIGKLDLADAVDVVAAILDLNDIQRIATAIKKMLALRVKVAKPPKQT